MTITYVGAVNIITLGLYPQRTLEIFIPIKDKSMNKWKIKRPSCLEKVLIPLRKTAD